MQRRVLSLMITLAAAVACGEVPVPTAALQAPDEPRLVNNGTPTGDAYGNVGVLLADTDGNGSWNSQCTGSLISPTVFLTAAHCVDFPAGTTYYVSFDPDVTTTANDLTSGQFITASAVHAHPGYSFPYNDLGVAILPAGSTEGIVPLELPPAGYLEQLKHRGILFRTPVVVVGYGIRSGGRGHLEVDNGDIIRQMATTKVLQLTDPWLITASNAVNAGRGGTCHGDSGGPVFLPSLDPDMVVGVDSFGFSGCKTQSGYVRIDIESARSFLGQYVTLP